MTDPHVHRQPSDDDVGRLGDELERDREAWNLPLPRTIAAHRGRITSIAVNREPGQDLQVEQDEGPWSASAA